MSHRLNRRVAFTVAGLGVLGAAGVAGAAQIGYRSQITSRNPLVYLQMDETSGTTATDSSPAAGGNGTHPGTYGAGVTLGTPTPSGSLATFGLNTGATNNPVTSTAAPITVAASTAFDNIGTGDFSVELWFNTSNVSSREDLFTYKGTPSDLGVQLSANGAGRLTFYHNGTIVNPATTVTPNVWHLVVATRSAGTDTIYLDGNSLGSAADALTVNTGGGAMLVGSNNPALPVTGTLDEFAFYNTALTPAQVTSDYTSGVPEPTSLGLLLVGGLGLLARRRTA